MLFRVEHFRTLFTLALFASVVFAPWWIALAFAVALSLRWRAWEVVIAGVLFDMLWLPSLSFSSWDTVPLGTILSLVLILVFEPLRRQLLIGPAIL
ncbi:MAG: hypothetical protein WA021_03310 [Minisyncoccia bacterium]